jgi:large subunit ribosomal protein L15
MREYIQRLPKLRGYNNKADVNDSALITLSMIEKIGGTVNAEAVVKAGYARKGQAIKVLANGEIKKAVTVEGINVSAGAKTAIEKAGGSVK